jgi:chlorophyll synthase
VRVDAQVINEYCDRDVDAINEATAPHPIRTCHQTPCICHDCRLDRISFGTVICLWHMPVVYVTLLECCLRRSIVPNHSVPRNLVGLAIPWSQCHTKGCHWIAGHLAFAQLTGGSLLLAGLYSLGAHGIMTINDFKSIDGDRMMGIKSIPARMGADWAAMSAVITINFALVAAMIYMLGLDIRLSQESCSC